MALLPVQPDLQALFAPILHTQRELARAHEIICQIDDLSDFTDEHHLQETSLHLVTVRQRLRAVCTLLKLRLTIQNSSDAFLSKPLPSQQQYSHRELRLPLNPQIDNSSNLNALCLPAARARRSGDNRCVPQSRKRMR